jgi:cytochrome c-type biogenesis protein CcmH/NrfG
VNARRAVGLMVAALIFYFLLIVQRAWVLVTSGAPVAVVLGLAVLVLPIVGAVLVLRELRFGVQTQLMAEELAADEALPVDDLPRTPGGRIERAAADETFARYRDEVEAAPKDWRAWYRLGVAYDDAGDRKRARSAMREAIKLRTELPPPTSGTSRGM